MYKSIKIQVNRLSGCFQHQRSAVQIPVIDKILNSASWLLTAEETKVKKMRPEMFFLKNTSKLISICRHLVGRGSKNTWKKIREFFTCNFVGKRLSIKRHETMNLTTLPCFIMCGTLHDFAWSHSCAEASMLIFSVSFQFYYMCCRQYNFLTLQYQYFAKKIFGSLGMGTQATSVGTYATLYQVGRWE